MEARVIVVEDASEFTDKYERVTFRFDGCDQMYDKLRMRNTEGLKLGDKVRVQFEVL